MTWGEFKRQVENKGVFDHTEIDYIDFDGIHAKALEVIVMGDGPFMVIEERS